MTSNILSSLSKHDGHISNLMRWIGQAEKLYHDIRQTEQNVELEGEIQGIIDKLINEVGVRVTNIILIEDAQAKVVPFTPIS